MKFVDNAFKYFFKNILWQLIIFLPVTIFFVTLIKPIFKANLIINLNTFEANNFVEFLKPFFPFGAMSALYLILFCILFSITLAMFTATSEYHMRTGKHNIKESLNLTITYFLPCLVICFILLILSVIINISTSAIIYLIYKLCIVDQVINVNGALLASIFYGLLSLIFAIISAFLLYTSNHIMINKSTLKESLGLTALNFDKKFFNYLISFILPIIILVPIYVFSPNYWWSAFIYGAGFVFVFAYICCLNLTAFYSINKLERKDLKIYPYVYFK